MAFYKKRIVRPDTQADIDWRIRSKAAGEQAISDRKAKFPLLTTDNFEEAERFQRERYNQLMQS